MEMLILAMLLSWAAVRYGVTDLVATVRGVESPRHVERMQRERLSHEREMARIRNRQGPTIGEAVASRIAHRIAEPRPRRDRSGQRPFRRAAGVFWEDCWDDAIDRHQRHRERKHEGTLPRQRAARAARGAARSVWDRARTRRRDQDTEVDSGLQQESRQDADWPDPGAPEPEPPIDAEVVTGPGPQPEPEPEPRQEPRQERTGPRAAAPPPPPAPEAPEVVRAVAERIYPESPAALPAATSTGQPAGEHEPETPLATVHQLHPNREGVPMTTPITSGETLDPQAALTFATDLATVAAQMQAELETSVANLTEVGVSGEPITLLSEMQEAAEVLAGKANAAVTAFSSHLSIQDVAQSDTTVGGERYLGIGNAR